MSSNESGPVGLRWFDPPRPVWVDLRTLFPVSPHHLHELVPGGIETRYEASGLLVGEVAWAIGGRLGLVKYQLLSTDQRWQTIVEHYMPTHLYRPKRRGRRDRDGYGHGH
ncbi:hypothetical protein [Amycolatopsis nigrescens]|uniref:hypothetical protein n=1 Tax=Amycolatopsis nigrescens TaxID=381445 RepID=UPI0012F97740|nr:hypothetical protein [Amycolatopsis nigrescens]